MSAFVVTTAHIDALVYASIHFDRYHGRDRFEKADEIGAMLLKENYRSVNYRYNEEDAPQRYTYKQPRKVPTLIEALKAIDCLEYQSCEHPEWETCEAKKFLDSLRKILISTLPGYNDAPWAIA